MEKTLTFIQSDFVDKIYTDNKNCPIATMYKRLNNSTQVTVGHDYLHDYSTRPTTSYNVHYKGKLGFTLEDFYNLRTYFALPKFMRRWFTAPDLTITLVKK